MSKTSIFLLSLLALAGCASPTVVSRVKPMDNQLSCDQLQIERSEAERYKDEAKKVSGVTGGNVARALLFWPALIGTAMNANEAREAADTRMNNLAILMNQKNCSFPAPALSSK